MTPSRKIPDNPILLDLLKSRLAPLPFDLDKSSLDQLARYIILFGKWNVRYNFSRSVSTEEIITDLIVPSLLFGLLMDHQASAVDLGTGPGIPGIPIKILFPDLKLTLIESSGRLLEFLRSVRDEIDLPDLTIEDGRAEDLAHNPHMRGRFDFAIARSFAPLPVVAETASGFLRPGGHLIVQCSGDTSSDIPPSTDPGIVFNRIGAVLPGIPDFHPLFFIRFLQISRAPEEYPRGWKKMKNQLLW